MIVGKVFIKMDENYRFIMYLDYDGVLNSENYYMKIYKDFVQNDDNKKDFYYRNFLSQFCIQKEAVECLNKVYDKFPFCIILTCTRRFEFTPTQWNFFFKELNKVKAYIGGRTGKSKNFWREDEIYEYHNHSGLFNFKNIPLLVIDDDTKDLQKYKDKLINTNTKTGLTLDYYDEIIEKLKEQGVE